MTGISPKAPIMSADFEAEIGARYERIASMSFAERQAYLDAEVERLVPAYRSTLSDIRRDFKSKDLAGDPNTEFLVFLACRMVVLREITDAKVTIGLKRLDALDAKAMRFRGVWQSSETYARGDLTTHKGALWHCNRPNTEKPGTNVDWQLAVKTAEGPNV